MEVAAGNCLESKCRRKPPLLISFTKRPMRLSPTIVFSEVKRNKTESFENGSNWEKN